SSSSTTLQRTGGSGSAGSSPVSCVRYAGGSGSGSGSGSGGNTGGAGPKSPLSPVMPMKGSRSFTAPPPKPLAQRLAHAKTPQKATEILASVGDDDRVWSLAVTDVRCHHCGQLASRCRDIARHVEPVASSNAVKAKSHAAFQAMEMVTNTTHTTRTAAT